MILNFLFNLFLSLLGLAIGGYILLAGRRALPITLAIVALLATAEIVAVLVMSYGSGLDLLREQQWVLLLIALGVGALGYFIGRAKTDLGVMLVGFFVGANITLWFEAIVRYLATDVIETGAETAVYLNIPLILIGGLIGLWLIRRFPDEILILFTVTLGTRVIFVALGLDNDSSITAIIILSLALLGVVVQYAQYLRKLKKDTPLPPAPEPALPELGTFSDLDSR